MMATLPAFALSAFLLVLFVQGGHGQDKKRENPIIVCKGRDLFLTRDPNGGTYHDIERVDYVFVGNPGGDPQIIANVTHVGDEWPLEVAENYKGRVKSDGPGIIVTPFVGESGIYETKFYMKDGFTEVFIDPVVVSDGLALEDGEFKMKIKKCFWNAAERKYYLHMQCGKFLWMTNPTGFEVEIDTPDKKRHLVNIYKDGYMQKLVFNPTVEGELTCRIPAKNADRVCGGEEAIETKQRFGPVNAVDCATMEKVDASMMYSEASISQLEDADDVHQETLADLAMADSEMAAAILGVYFKHDGEIKGLKSKDDELATEVGDLENFDTALGDQINDLKKEDENLEGEVEALKMLIAGLKRKVAALERKDRDSRDVD